jgi:hypothetical protein
LISSLSTQALKVRQTVRAAMSGRREMRQWLAQSRRADVVDIARVADRTHARDLRTCGGCDAEFGSELGARYSMTGWVQKVSNLILNMNIVVRDAKTGQVILSKSVDMRGNTDESWSRALDWLVDRPLLAPGVGVFWMTFMLASVTAPKMVAVRHGADIIDVKNADGAFDAIA